MNHRISKRGIDFIKGWESFVPHVYDDKLPPVKIKGKRQYREWNGEKPRGTLTIGYGHTNAAKHPLKIKQGLRITEAEARDILDVDLDDVEAAVNRLVKVELTQGQFDAIVSLTFNMGEWNLKKSSLLARLNKGDFAGARKAFDLYVRSGGEFMQGLQNRRDGEQALWDSRYENAKPKLKETVDPHPTEVDAPPVEATKAVVTARTIGGTVAVATGAAQAVSAVVGPVSETVEQVKVVTDNAGQIVDVSKQLVTVAPDGFWLNALAFMRSPTFLAVALLVVCAAWALTWYMRKRAAQ